MRSRSFFIILACITVMCIFIGCSAENSTENVIDIPALSSVPAQKAPMTAISPTLSPAFIPTPSLTPEITSTPEAEKTKDEENAKNFPVDNENFYFKALNDGLKERITGMSFPSNDEECRIKYDDLRYVGILYWDFEGQEHTGELIVNRKLANEVVEIFYALYQEKYPLASVRLVDDYGEPGDDNKSMADNNSSAFNYRRVTGSKKLSRHSYGAAIDINPLFNPYIDGGRVAPPAGEAYTDRSRDFPGKIDHDDTCYQLFKKYGWSWGGDWSGDKDYQHFSKDVGEY